jgi:hypothetical protein
LPYGRKQRHFQNAIDGLLMTTRGGAVQEISDSGAGAAPQKYALSIQ